MITASRAAASLPPEVERSHRLAEDYRALMTAMARPGLPQTAPAPPAGAAPDHGAAPADLSPLSPAAARIVLTVVDQTAPLWLAPSLAASPSLAERLRFETGAAPAGAPDEAAFLLGRWPDLEPVLDEVLIGTPERPDLSATLIVELGALHQGPALGAHGARLTGPGVNPEAPTALWIAGAPPALWRFQQRNRARFPLGVDLFLTAGERLAALPRSVSVEPL